MTKINSIPKKTVQDLVIAAFDYNKDVDEH